jgi:hypothetical protein
MHIDNDMDMDMNMDMGMDMHVHMHVHVHMDMHVHMHVHGPTCACCAGAVRASGRRAVQRRQRVLRRRHLPAAAHQRHVCGGCWYLPQRSMSHCRDGRRARCAPCA